MVFVAFAIIAICFFLISCFWWYGTIPKNLPPGPRGLPFLGSSLEMMKSTSIVEKLSKWSKRYGNIYSFYVGEKLVVVLSDWESINEAFVKRADAFGGRLPLWERLQQKPPIGFALMEGQLWKRHRHFLMREFGFNRSILEPHIKVEVQYCMTEIGNANGKPIDIHFLIKNALSNIICILAFGYRFEYNDVEFKKLLEYMHAFANQGRLVALSPYLLSDKITTIVSRLAIAKQFETLAAETFKWVKKQTVEAQQKSEEHTKNYVQSFRQQQAFDDSDFTNDKLSGIVYDLFVGGSNTTTNVLYKAIFYLAHNIDIQERMYKEIVDNADDSMESNYSGRHKMPFTHAVIMEASRMGNTAPLGVFRRTLTNTELFGYNIPEDTIIIPFLTNVLYNPNVYPEPEKFNPDRFLKAHELNDDTPIKHCISFQIGKRVCPGEPFVIMALFLFLTEMVNRFKFFFPNDSKPVSQYLAAHRPVQFEICAISRLNAK